jgi:hypothetical protein
MPKLSVLLIVLFLTMVASSEPLIYQDPELGFSLTYPSNITRHQQKETKPIDLFLQEGSATLLVGTGFDEEGLDQSQLSLEVLGADAKPYPLDGLQFYRTDKPHTTEGGNPTLRTTFFFYDPDSGGFIQILVTTEVDAPEGVRQTLLNVAESFKVD